MMIQFNNYLKYQTIYYTGKMLERIQNELIKENTQLQKKSDMFEYYMSLENTEKQRKLILWWENIIQSAIRKSGQIYLSPADLQIIFSLHGLKPVPLERVLSYLTQNNKYEWIGKEKQEQNKKTGWLSSITNYLWKTNDNNQKATSMTKSSFKSMALYQNEKIIVKKYKEEIQQEIIKILKKELRGQNTVSYDHVYTIIKNTLSVNISSIEMILSEMQAINRLKFEQVQNKKILIYSQNKKLMNDKNWVQVEKSKFILKSTIMLFDHKIDTRFKEEDAKLQQAKNYINIDQNRSRRILGQMRMMSKTTTQLQNRRRLLKQTLDELQINQMNSTTVDVISECQKIIQKTMVDVQKLQTIKDRSLQISYNQKQMNEFMSNASNKQQIENEVDNMLAELEKQIVKSKQNRKIQQPNKKQQLNYS